MLFGLPRRLARLSLNGKRIGNCRARWTGSSLYVHPLPGILAGMDETTVIVRMLGQDKISVSAEALCFLYVKKSRLYKTLRLLNDATYRNASPSYTIKSSI